MATWYLYRCKECGYEVTTSHSGRYALMSGWYQNYLCPKCKEIVSIKTDTNNTTKNTPTCPDCGSETVTRWTPKQGKCPKCNGKMELVPDEIIMAD